VTMARRIVNVRPRGRYTGRWIVVRWPFVSALVVCAVINLCGRGTSFLSGCEYGRRWITLDASLLSQRETPSTHIRAVPTKDALLLICISPTHVQRN
jgi:hypothetical protein